MKLLRMGLAGALMICLAGVAYVVGQATEPSGARMMTAANRFLESLPPEQRSRATFPFDDKERLNWYFTPQQDKARKATRKGLALQDMTPEQREAARELLRTGTSPEGFKKATTIMSLEAILNELEKGGAMVRNPEWYFFSVFGTPSKTGRWGWRVEGHHLSLNYTLDGTRVVSATPSFFGANPATVMAGPQKGLRTLPESEDLAKELFRSLDEEQRKAAARDSRHKEVLEKTPAPELGPPEGLAAAKMTEKQRAILVRLLEAYANRLPADVAEVELTRARKAGLDQVYFAYHGGLEPGQPHTYRIQGPTLLVEFLNVQADSAKNPANHIHSALRDVKGDFGLPR